MKYGKRICQSLKIVRKQIADANEIPYEISDCPHQGDCSGTCPKCESEIRYIENQLNIRRAAGKAVSLVGLSLGISSAFATNTPADTYTQDTDSIKTNQACNDSISQEEKEDDLIFGCVIDPSPTFPGGDVALMKFIKENLRYPAGYAGGPNPQGRVTLSFTIDEDGSITDIEVMRSPDPSLTEEALRVLKLMPKWIPASHKGKYVKVKYVLPFIFKLKETELIQPIN